MDKHAVAIIRSNSLDKELAIRHISQNISKFSSMLFMIPFTSIKLRNRVRIRSYSGPPFSGIFLHARKCGKNAYQNNSEYGRFFYSVEVEFIGKSLNCGDDYRLGILVKCRFHGKEKIVQSLLKN